MKEFRTKEMSIKVRCACVNDDYFDLHYRDYYDYLTYELIKSESRGSYVKSFYKLKTFESVANFGIDEDLYCELPFFVCASRIY